uniref:Uncharacterized protein n=1 Tax=Molossus molossus TaxID=27622 RepID=A0A7J8F9G0_MOLMO|nr:hypothetical protein HJG59_008592 [Molossus molossus]
MDAWQPGHTCLFIKAGSACTQDRGHVLNEDECHEPVSRELSVTLPTERGFRSQHPQGLERGLRHLPSGLEAGARATSEPHQHQAHPCLLLGEPLPGEPLPALSQVQPSLQLVGGGAYLQPPPGFHRCFNRKTGSVASPSGHLCTGIATGFLRCPELDLAAWPGARSHQVSSSL